MSKKEIAIHVLNGVVFTAVCCIMVYVLLRMGV